MLAIQVLVDGRQAAVVHGLDLALRHAGAAVLGSRDPDALARALSEERGRLRESLGGDLRISDVHLLRIRFERLGGAHVEFAWLDLTAEPGRSQAALRYDFDDAPDPGYALAEALSSLADRDDEGDAAYVEDALARRCALWVRPGPGETAAARFERIKRMQGLLSPGDRNPLALLPRESEIGGDHAGALAVLPARALERFRTLSAPGREGRPGRDPNGA